jgi:hypothetical protein
LLVISYGRETWFLTLKGEHRLRAFKHRVIQKRPGLWKDGVRGGCRKPNTQEFYNLNSSLNSIRLIKSRRMRSNGHLAYIIYYLYDIFLKLQLGCHLVAVVQYTFTHKQYTEWHRRNNTQNNKNFRKSAWRAPSVRVIPWHLPYHRGKSTANPVMVAEECHLARRRYINVQ